MWGQGTWGWVRWGQSHAGREAEWRWRVLSCWFRGLCAWELPVKEGVLRASPPGTDSPSLSPPPSVSLSTSVSLRPRTVAPAGSLPRARQPHTHLSSGPARSWASAPWAGPSEFCVRSESSSPLPEQREQKEPEMHSRSLRPLSPPLQPPGSMCEVQCQTPRADRGRGQ